MDQDQDQAAGQPTLFPKNAGEKLRDARVAQGLSLNDIATRTRVPIRHLEAIEDGRFDTMPSPTYAVGFAKTYARAVGLDEAAIASEIRANPQLPLTPTADPDLDDLDNPRRMPSRGVAVIAVLVALVLLAGAGIWFGSDFLRGGGSAPAAPQETVAAAPADTPTPAATPAPETGGQVTLTASDTVWLRVYDATGKTLMEKTLQPGDRYDVPADANGPMINVGRPDKLQVTLNGATVPPLGDGKVAIKDVGIGAAAIRARMAGTPAPTATPAPGASATPPVSTSPSPRPTRSPRATPRPRATHTPRPEPTQTSGPENLLPPSVQPTATP